MLHVSGSNPLLLSWIAHIQLSTAAQWTPPEAVTNDWAMMLLHKYVYGWLLELITDGSLKPTWGNKTSSGCILYSWELYVCSLSFYWQSEENKIRENRLTSLSWLRLVAIIFWLFFFQQQRALMRNRMGEEERAKLGVSALNNLTIPAGSRPLLSDVAAR